MKDPNILIEKRRQEILDAFFKLYETRVFGDIHIKAISEETSFTRATIYNYFKNMDEIFLCAYRGEYVLWSQALRDIEQSCDVMSHEQLAAAIAHSLEARERMLRLSTADFHEREAHCRRELIFDHKQAFSGVIEAFHDCIAKFCPEKDEKDIHRILYIFFPFMHGMYRYIDITPVQDAARQAAHFRLAKTSIYEMAYSALLQILK